MKTSELIRQLTAMMKKHGDLETWISINGDECRGLSALYYANGLTKHSEIEKPGFVVVKL